MTRTAAVDAANVEAALRGFFVDRSGGALAADAIEPTRHIFDAGYVDSMSSLTLLEFVEERYGVVVPEVELVGRLSNLVALAKYVAEHAASPQ